MSTSSPKHVPSGEGNENVISVCGNGTPDILDVSVCGNGTPGQSTGVMACGNGTLGGTSAIGANTHGTAYSALATEKMRPGGSAGGGGWPRPPKSKGLNSRRHRRKASQQRSRPDARDFLHAAWEDPPRGATF